jgi:hypothetical protein
MKLNSTLSAAYIASFHQDVTGPGSSPEGVEFNIEIKILKAIVLVSNAARAEPIACILSSRGRCTAVPDQGSSVENLVIDNNVSRPD